MPLQEIPSEIDKVSALLKQMILEDPYLRAMHEGKMKWGDLMLIYEKENPRPKKQEPVAVVAAEEPMCPTCKSNTRCYCGYPQEPLLRPTEKKPEVQDCGICTLRLGNLPRDISAQELKTVFSAYGTVRDVHIPKNMDRSSPYFGTIRGFAMVEMDKSWEATNALSGLYGSLTIRTKKITIEFAKSDRKRPDQMAAAMGGAGAPPARPALPPLPPRIQRQTAQGVPALPPRPPRYIHKEEPLPYNHFLQEDGSILHF